MLREEEGFVEGAVVVCVEFSDFGGYVGFVEGVLEFRGLRIGRLGVFAFVWRSLFLKNG